MNTKVGNRNTGITHGRLTDNRCPVRRPLPGSGIVAAGGTSADSRAARPPDANRTRQPHRSAGRILSLLLALPLFFGLASQAMAQIEVPGISPSTPVRFTSTGPYTIDETITVTVTFVDTVTVVGTPQITLMVGTNALSADYTSGTGNTVLVFTYTVAADENDENGVSIPANALALNGGTIQGETTGTDAILTHAAVLDDPAQVVDTRMPEFVSASVTADNLVLTYDETLDSTSTPANDDYTIMVTDTATPSPTVPTVNDPVVINGANVMLTLSRNITTTETFRLTYTPGTNPLRDVAGNNADSFMNEEVVRPSQGPMFDDMVDDQTYTVGTPVDLTLPTAMASSSEGVDYDLVGPDATLVDNDLPAGLTFNMTLRTLSGTPTTAMDEVMLTYTANSSGRSTSLTFTVIVVAAAAASVTVTETDSDTTVAENDGTDTYTVVLGSRPTADVTITPASDNINVATVSPTSLTFTTANWDAAQTVTVTGVDDDIDNPGDARTATVSHTAASTDTNYEASSTAGSNIASVTVTVTDDDSVPTFSGAGDAQTYTVGTSIGTVTLPLATGGDGALTYTLAPPLPTGLTFTAADRTITGTPAGTAQAATTYTYTVSDSDADISPADTDSVSFTITILPVAGVTVTPATLSVPENGSSTADYTVVLDTAPTADVTIAVASDTVTAATVSSASLTFTPTNWDTAQTVTVTGVDDDVDNPSDERTASLSHTAASADGNYEGVAISIESVTVTVDDDDAAGVTVDPLALTVDEAGSDTTADYTVVLDTAPTADVTIAVASDTVTAATVSSASLTFTPTNWDTAQTVTVTGVDDDVDNPSDERTASLSHTAASADGNYEGVAISIESVTVTVDDDDAAGVTVDPLALTVDEAGSDTTADYTVVLDTAPTADVTIAVASDTVTAATVSSASLTFTPTNWDTAQTVTVTGVDDDVDNPSDERTASLSHTAASADGNYEGVAISIESVTVTVDDDDAAGVTVDPLALTVDEAGSDTTADYTVVLDTAPTADVTIAVASDTVTAATVSSASLTFTPTNWDTAQTVTVTGVDDDVDNPSDERTASLSHTAASADGNYEGVAISIESVTVTVDDDDAAGVTVDPLALTVDEAGSDTTADYTVVLDTAPTADVTIAVASDTVTAATVSSASLTFTPTNWDTAQTVTVTGVDDDVDNPSDERTASLSHTAASADGNYEGVAISIESVTVTVDDDDAAGVTVDPLALTVDEAGSDTTADYTVVLDTAPTADVTIAVASDTVTAATVSSASLTFTPTNWDTAQTVTVTGVDDDVDNVGDQRTATVTHTAASADGNYEGVAISIESVTVTITDDDDAPARFAALNEVILSEVIRSMTDSTVNAITQRIKQSTAPGPKAATLTLNGRAMSLADLTPTDNLSGVADNPSVAGMLTGIARSVADDSWQLGRALGNSSFMLPTDSDLAELTLWGGGDYRELSGESGALDWDGDLGSGILGADTPVSDTLLVGLAVSWQSGDFDYKEVTADAAHSGDYEVNQFSAQPYIGWSSPDGRQDLWATAGYGWGDVEIDDQAMGRQSSNLNTQNVGVGGSGQLLQSGASTLRLKGQFHQTWAEVEGNNDLLRKLNLDVRRLRLALEGTHEQPLANGAQLTPTVEVGLRYDAGDGPTGSGIEVGAGLRFTAPAIGLSAEGRGRVLLAHSGDYDDWGLNGTLRFAPQSNGRGLAFSLQPAYGATASRVTHLWEQDSVVSPTADAPHGARMDADLSYGLDWAEALVTPYVRLSLAGSQTYRIGSRLQLHDGLALSLEGLRQEADTRSVEHGILLKLRLDW